MAIRNQSFWNSAFAWQESVTPKVMGRVVVFTVLSIGTTYLYGDFPKLSWPVGLLEVSGAVIGLLLIIRTNAGYDRWWEARKLWGGIVNQSRNLAIMGITYGPQNKVWRESFTKLVSEFPHLTISVLREPLKKNEALECSSQISRLILNCYRSGHINGFEFQLLEQQRTQLIDHLGACERILKTPIPKVLDIKVRRFLLIYLLLVPLGLVAKTGWYTPVIMFIISYSLLAIDQIGVELQNPFRERHLSALPIQEIAKNIELQIQMLAEEEPSQNPSVQVRAASESPQFL